LRPSAIIFDLDLLKIVTFETVGDYDRCTYCLHGKSIVGGGAQVINGTGSAADVEGIGIGNERTAIYLLDLFDHGSNVHYRNESGTTRFTEMGLNGYHVAAVDHFPQIHLVAKLRQLLQHSAIRTAVGVNEIDLGQNIASFRIHTRLQN